MKNLDNPPLSINLRRYFVADCDVNGEVVNDSIHEINLEEALAEAKEQIQEDVITYMGGFTPPFTFTDEDKQSITDDVCDIVTDNFSKIEYK